MDALLFIRHAETKIDPAQPSHTWRLTEGAYTACRQLAAGLEPFHLNRIVTSEEFKAAETGRLLAEALGLPCEAASGLHEHERKGVPVMEQRAWLATVQRLFERPDEPVLGTETAREALDRFEEAVRRILARHPDERLAIVSHGTVMSLFVARHNEVDAFTFWKGLWMPDTVVLSLPDFKLQPSNGPLA